MADTEQSQFERIAAKFAALHPDKSSDEGQMARTPNRRTGSVQLAYSRPDDPMFYWRQNNIPFDIWNRPESLKKAQEYSRILYITHPVIGSAIDIYAKYPLAGMEIICPKDPEIAEFASTLFFDDLDYEQYLATVGREHWMVGESFPLASFNDLMGVWEDDELLLPDDVIVERTMFSRDPVLKMRLPLQLMEVLRTRTPLEEYRRIVESYPELLGWVSSTPDEIASFFTVSNDLLFHFKRDADAFHPRGIPILMRAFRAVVQEEMLNAAQDGIASRLYTPLILAKIGASATDLGLQTPWIPDQGDLDAFNEQVNLALAADFRMITTHFAVNMQSVFGRESVPDMSRDFDRLEEKMLQAFGLSRTLLTGAGAGETYAADALNRDMISQILTEYQRKIKRFFRRRAEVVAEAQGHYDYEMKGGRPKPIMEEFLETDPETGDQRISTRPKLLLPQLRIKSMNMKDEDKFHALLEQLRDAGIPISQRSRLQNIPVDLEEEARATMEEQVDQAVFAQEVRKQTYIRLKAKNLPIPDDLKADFEPKAHEPPSASAGVAVGVGGANGDGAEDQTPTTLGLDNPAALVALMPDAEGIDDDLEDDEMGTNSKGQLPRNRARPLVEEVQRRRPPESDEQRRTMPKASALNDLDELPEVDLDVVPSHLGAMSDDELAEYRTGGMVQVEGEDGETGEVWVSPDPEPLGTARLAHRGLRHKSIFFKARSDEDTPVS